VRRSHAWPALPEPIRRALLALVVCAAEKIEESFSRGNASQQINRKYWF
jgi:hypothetical protein